jgi:LCP family protein required for cell wall assembly
MFEHLDDPQPYTPPAGLQATVRGRVRRRRRRRVAVAGGVASVAALGVGSVLAVRDRLEPQRIEVGGLATEPDGADAVTVRGPDPVREGEPVTVLVVGVDETRPAGGSEPLGTKRSDTIALVRIDPEAGEVRLLTVPRDLTVEGAPAPGRINTVFADGGPEALVRAIDTELGIPVDHYVEVDFAGAIALVDAIGGVRVAVDRPMRDRAGAVLDAGCQELDGAATLGLGRARMVEVQQDDGSWAVDPTGGIGRETRGAVVAAALLQAAGRIGVGDLPALVETGLGMITVDDGLDVDDLERWARDARDDRFVPLGLPVTSAVIDRHEVLRLDDGAAAVVAAFQDGGTDPVPVVADGTPVTEATGLRPC